MVKQSPNLKQLADKVIATNEQFAHLKDCKICFLESDKSKKSSGKIVYADTEKVSPKWKAISDFDFVITFYDDSLDGKISQSAMEILMIHELKHVGFDGGKCSIIPHDVADFKEIINAHGFDWIRS